MPQLLLDPRGITGDLEVRPAPATLPERAREFGCLPDFTLWRSGDLLLFSELERGFISNHIVKAQERFHYAPEDARWHHVAVYIGSSDLCEAAPEDGVRCQPVAEYVGNTLIRVRRNENLNADDAYGIAIRALMRLQKNYSLSSIVISWIRSWRRPTPPSPEYRSENQAVICSQLFHDAYMEATGLSLFDRADAPMLPALLSATDRLTDVASAWTALPTHQAGG